PQPTARRPSHFVLRTSSFALPPSRLAPPRPHTALAPDGLYLEPRAPLTAVLAAFERCGIRIGGVRSAGNEPSWHTSARPAALARTRLSNQRSAEWLPTLPCA
ncbi:MAG TPA: hypothetical protein PKD75_13165, partial [Tepidiformaceae bacterium]|nr:hypothetical protein [Tepidiformaceae bacterium]